MSSNSPSALVNITLASDANVDEVVHKIRAIPKVLFASIVLGKVDVIAGLAAGLSVNEISSIAITIRQIDGVSGSNTEILASHIPEPDLGDLA